MIFRDCFKVVVAFLAHWMSRLRLGKCGLSEQLTVNFNYFITDN